MPREGRCPASKGRGLGSGPWAGRARDIAHLSGRGGAPRPRESLCVGGGDHEWLPLTLSYLVPPRESPQQCLQAHESPSEAEGKGRAAASLPVCLLRKHP